MKNYGCKTGLTLVEMLIVVFIIAILVTIVISVAGRIDTEGKINIVKSSFVLIDTALSQFKDYEYSYDDADYADFKFPLDCNGFTETELTNDLSEAPDVINVTIVGNHSTDYSGSEALYFFLSQVPACRQTISRIDRSLISETNQAGEELQLTVDGRDGALLRFIDPWGTTLRYDYYDEQRLNNDWAEDRRSFPLVISAGPDRIFNTIDDITNKNK